MQVLQVHYTSCLHGTSGFGGFQVRAISEGVDSGDAREIVKHCSYAAPLTEKEKEARTEEEIKACPIAYRNYRLSSGRIALTRICYTGVDYSGVRLGNYFAHTLILPAETINRRPIDYLDWQEWKNNLDKSEDVAPPPVLTCINLADLESDVGESRLKIKAFLMQDSNHIKRLENMVKALLMSQFDSRRVIIYGDNYNNVSWMRALQYCFPSTLANAIESSSYENNLDTAPLLTAIVKNSGVTINSDVKNYTFYVFDEYSGIDSEISANDKWNVIGTYAKLVTHLLIAQPEQLKEFYDFIDDIGIKKVDKNTANTLGLAASIFGLSMPDFKKDSENRLSELINYATTIPETSPAWGLCSHRLYPLLAGLDSTVDSDALRVKFLIAAVRAFPNDTFYLDEACRVWLYRQLREFSENNIPGSELDKLRQSINSLPQGAQELYSTLLKEETIAEIVKILKQSSTEIAEYAFKEIGEALIQVGRNSVLDQPEIGKLLAALQDNQDAYKKIIPIKLNLADTPEIFISICNSAGINENIVKNGKQELIKIFTTQIKERSEEFSQQVRELMPEIILVLELEEIVKYSKNPVSDYFSYREKISTIRNDIGFSKYKKLTVNLIDKLENNNVVLKELAEKLLKLKELYELKGELFQIKKLLGILNESVSLNLDDDVDDDVMDNLPKLASDMLVTLKPNRVLIRRFITNSEYDKSVFPMQDLISLHNDLLVLNEEDYLYVSNKILDFCASNEKQFNSINHLQVILTICRSNANYKHNPNDKYTPNDKKFSEFQNRYLKWLKEVLNRYPKALETYTSLWVGRSSEIDRDMILFSLSNKIMPILADAIANYFQINHKKRNFSESNFWRQLDDQKNEEDIKELQALVTEAKKGVFDHVSDIVNTFKNVFSNPFKRK